MTSSGPLTIYIDDETIYGLNNPLRFAEEQTPPSETYIRTMYDYYKSNLKYLAPGVVHGSSHELSAWLLTSSAQLIARGRTDDAIEVLNEADKLLVEGQQFPEDNLWRAAVFYNVAVCMNREPPGRDYKESIFQIRTARRLLARATHSDVNKLSLSAVERAVSESENLMDIHDRPMGT